MFNTNQAHFFDQSTMTLTHENGDHSLVPENKSIDMSSVENMQEYLMDKNLIIKGDDLIMLA